MYRFIPLEAFEHSPHAVLAVDDDGAVRFCNEAAAAIVGADRRAALGRPCWKVAGLRTPRGSAFCSPECPVQRLARAGVVPPVHRVVSAHNRSSALKLDLLTFFVPPTRGGRSAVLHLLLPVVVTTGRRRESPTRRTLEAARSIHLLSPREIDVLRSYAEGRDSEAVARRLSISVTTVRNHAQSIYKKLGVHRRIEAVLAFVAAPR